MIIRNFLNKIYISKYSYLIIFLCFITGLIKDLTIIIILILFHEFGHYLISYIFKWNINRINIYPFGGLITYDDQIDKPFKEEFLVTLGGPINQWILFVFIYVMHNNYFISDYYYDKFYNYHLSIFLFNLLPIIPLDGSKIINILLNKLFNFKLSYKLLSVISIIFLIVFTLKFNNYIINTFLIYEIVLYIKNKDNNFNRFLLEKYLYKNKYKKILRINNINKMKRNKKHIIKNNNMYITEKEFINKVYNMDYNMDHNMDK